MTIELGDHLMRSNLNLQKASLSPFFSYQKAVVFFLCNHDHVIYKTKKVFPLRIDALNHLKIKILMNGFLHLFSALYKNASCSSDNLFSLCFLRHIEENIRVSKGYVFVFCGRKTCLVFLILYFLIVV